MLDNLFTYRPYKRTIEPLLNLRTILSWMYTSRFGQSPRWMVILRGNSYSQCSCLTIYRLWACAQHFEKIRLWSLGAGRGQHWKSRGHVVDPKRKASLSLGFFQGWTDGTCDDPMACTLFPIARTINTKKLDGEFRLMLMSRHHRHRHPCHQCYYRTLRRRLWHLFVSCVSFVRQWERRLHPMSVISE